MPGCPCFSRLSADYPSRSEALGNRWTFSNRSDRISLASIDRDNKVGSAFDGFHKACYLSKRGD